VPIFSGSGIRIKILEAMAIGIAVISTQKGAQGIPYKNGHDIIIANSAEDFYKYICLLTKNREMAIKIGKNGKRLIEKYFCEKEILKNLNDLV
jgi:glycosyltransferase involved in cell wall biosynthesis